MNVGVKISSFFLRNIAFIIVASSLTSIAHAQLGPGGVSHETPNTLNPIQSDCRLWLDAGTLINLEDGDEIEIWNDISSSEVNDAAYTSDKFQPPFLRDNPSAAINGYPVVTFEDGRMLQIVSSTDLNLANTTTYAQTTILAFRTSEDVTSRQMLWEEGGATRGMNIYIYNGELYLGAHDVSEDSDIGHSNHGKVPKFGFNYIKTPIQPNSTYVVSHIFDAPTDNTLNGSIRGYLNGMQFGGTLWSAGPENPGIGGVYRHTDPIGLGAVNNETYFETGEIRNKTGQFAFTGRLAEICYYNRLLNDAERIIVENYLGAKYYANIIVNDRYQYKSSYGKDVIGIGQTTNSISTRHSVSQGRNPFEMSPANETNSFNSPNVFLLAGHDGMPLTLTDNNVPNDPGSTKRTERIWRFDERGELSTIKFRFHSTDLPPLPAGYDKYTLIFDDSSPYFPNFSTANSKVYELKVLGDGYYQAEVNVVSGAFMTIGVIKPQVSFLNAEAYAIESNPAPDSSFYVNKVFVRLNYIPASMVKIDYFFSDGTAGRLTDYGYQNSIVNSGISFAPGVQEMAIGVWIKNDLEEESTETFKIDLTIGPNTTANLGIGLQNQHTFTIFDDDPPPKIGFAESTSLALESIGSHTINLVRTGTTAGTAYATVKIIYDPSTTATLDEDFSFPLSKTVHFADGESIKSFTIDILDDDLDEEDEFIHMLISFIGGDAALEPGSSEHTVTIVDDDEPPTVEFTSKESQNYESTGAPIIMIELDRKSSKTVSVSYDKIETLTHPATEGQDYTLTYPATIQIQPGKTIGYPLNFHVLQDAYDEGDETVEFLLTGAVNANLGSNQTHVFTIKDYSAFEWKGAAGIGNATDNIFWIDVNRQSGNQGDQLGALTDFSPHNNDISQTESDKRPKIQTTSNLINGRKTLEFDGVDDSYILNRSGLINTAPEMSKKDYFFVIKTSDDVTNPQVIYQQGGTTNGFAIYIKDGSLYFNVWGNPDSGNGVATRWGAGAEGSNSARYARFDNIQPGTPYIVSCLFDRDATQKIRIYVNGQLGQRTETQTCGLVYKHGSPPCIGGSVNRIYLHDGTAVKKYFKGYFAEMIHFHEAPVTEARRIILENYFSGKYDIPLTPAEQKIHLSNDYTHQIAGIGQLTSDDAHGDSQGSGILRMNSAFTVADNSFLFWGENNVPLNQTWPYSNGTLPAGIEERSGKVWQISKSGNINGVTVLISFASLQNAASISTGNLKLLVHHNSDSQNFAGATVVNASLYDPLGYIVKFSKVNFDDGDYFALANSSSIVPLPIELLSFTAKAKDNRVDLNWITSTETGNEYFEVERAGRDLDFKSVLTQPGAGYSNRTNYYSDIDKDPLPGMSYYRLKQVDYDGRFSYSDVVSVYFEHSDEDDFDFWIYPNPTNSHRFTITNTGKLPTDEMISLSIVNISGQVVHSQQIDPTNTSVPIVLPHNIVRGTYMVVLQNDQIMRSYKLVLN